MGKIQMLEVREPKFVKFEKDGETVEGVLQSIDVIEIQQRDSKDQPLPGVFNKAARLVLIEGHMNYEDGTFSETGDRVCFLATRQILDAIKLSAVGLYIMVRREGTDAAAGKNGNPMKRFKIFKSDRKPDGVPVSAGDALGISDDDIPF